MYRDVLEYYRKASSKDIKEIDDNNNPVLAPYSVNPVYEKLLRMTDEELKKHKLFCTFLSDDTDKWKDLYSGCSKVTVDDALLSEVQDSLNESQQEALKIAVNEPISLIQGPPGTGKTHMILALLHVLTRKLHKTVAVVSVNNEAIANITDEILVKRSPKEYVRDLKEITAKLGNLENKQEFNGSDNNTHGYHFNTERNGFLDQNETGTIEECFRNDYRIITSTPHSLMKLFSDCYEEKAMYDYVIVDETSQMNPMLGLIAMFPARHLVLVGDDEQIPPIVNEERYTDISLTDISEQIFRLVEDRSFLQVTSVVLKRWLQEVYGKEWSKKFDRITYTLQKHYRCDAGIFDFCRENFYKNAGLEIVGEKPSGNICPMKCIFYNGSFTERCYIGKTKWRKQNRVPVLDTVKYNDRDDPYVAATQISGVKSFYIDTNGQWQAEMSPCESSRNMRQIGIFLEEEWDKIVDDIMNNPEFTVCILSPYKAQIYELQERIFRLKPESKAETATYEFPINDAWPLDSVLAKNTKNAPNEWGTFLTVLGADDDYTSGEDTQDNACADEGRSGNEHNYDTHINGLIIKNRSKSLTIHSVQGQGFDKVYLLPVDDRPYSGREEKPTFAQIRHLVNVAVSRAKKEFCLIASTNLMAVDIRRGLGMELCDNPAGFSMAGKGVSNDLNKRYVDELIRYIYNAYYSDHKNGYFAEPDHELKKKYGFHADQLHTLFEISDVDAENWVRKNGLSLLENNESGIEYMSKPEAKVDMFLEAAASKLNFSFDPVDIDDSGHLKGISRQVNPDGHSEVFMDFALRDNEGSILCFIEEDGIAHRYRRNEDRSHKSDLKEYREIQELIDFIKSCRKKDQICAGLGVPVIRWDSDSSHMLSMDGITADERLYRKKIIEEAKRQPWDLCKPWQEQIEKFYEFVELKMVLDNLR